MEKWFDSIEPDTAVGQKRLDMPLRMLFQQKKVINGIGNYSTCQFFRTLEEELGLNFASPIQMLFDDREVLKAFLTSLHRFCFRRNNWLRSKIEVNGLPSGIRQNDFWEDLYLRRHVSAYFAAGSVPYEIHTPHHTLTRPKIWSRSTNLPPERVRKAKTSPTFTTNSLTVGPAAFMTGEDKVIDLSIVLLTFIPICSHTNLFHLL
ncbi:MAG: hypothetical protein ACK50N_01300 [Flavobacteriales bacterium]